MRNVRLSLLALSLMLVAFVLPAPSHAGQIPIFSGTVNLTASQLNDYNLTIQGNVASGGTLVWPNGLHGQWSVTNSTNAAISIQYSSQATPLQIAQGATQLVYGNGNTLFAQSGGSGGISSLTGDVTASGSGSVAASLAAVNSTPGSYTAANISVDAKGRITSAANGPSGADPSGLQSDLSTQELAGTADMVGITMSPNTSQTLLNYAPGTPGYVDAIHITCGLANTSCGDSVITVYVDGELIPSIITDIQNLCATTLDNANLRVATTHTSTEFNESNGIATLTQTCGIKYPIPFQSSINIVLTSSSDQGAFPLFTDIHYVNNVSLPYKLRSANVTQANSIVMTPTQQDNGTFQFLNLPAGNAGWVVDHTVSFSSGTGLTFLENTPAAFIDGQSLSGAANFIKNGGEDYFLSGYYFTVVPSSTPYALVTAKSTQSGGLGNITANLDLLAYIGGLKFNNGIVFRFQGSPGKVHPASSTNVNISYLMLYYQPLAPATPVATPTYSTNFTSGALGSGMAFTRASTATYTNSSGVLSTAGVNAARFDYNPDTLQPNGLLMEQSGTNLDTTSNVFTGGNWVALTTSGSTQTFTANSALSPDGTTDATLVAYNRTAQTNFAQNAYDFTSVAGTYTASVWLKAKTPSDVGELMNIVLVGGTGTYGAFNTVTLTSNWKRYTTTATLAAGTGAQFVMGGIASGNGGTGSNGAVNYYTYGAQIEQLPFASSYIPTTAGAVTRSADSLSIASPSFFNASAGTIGIGATLEGLNGTTAPYLASFSDGTTSNNISIVASATGVPEGQNTVSGTAYTSAGSLFVLNPNIPVGMGLSYSASSNLFAARKSQDGAGTFGTGPIPSGINRLDIGNREDGTLGFNGWIKQFNYWNTVQSVSNVAQ